MAENVPFTLNLVGLMCLFPGVRGQQAEDQTDLSSDLEPAVTSSLLLTVTPVMKHSSVPFHCVCVCVGWWWGPYE